MKHQLITLITTALSLRAEPVSTAEALAVAVTEAKSGSVIELAVGTFRLTQPLDVKGGVMLIIRCVNDTDNITISGMTLTDPRMHGAIFGVANKGLHFHDLRIADFMYSGIHTYIMQSAYGITARTTKEPRTEGLFGFNEKSDFKTFRFTGNIIECIGTPRPLFRNDASGAALVENNTITNVTDPQRYANKLTGAKIGLEQPLKFACDATHEKQIPFR